MKPFLLAVLLLLTSVSQADNCDFGVVKFERDFPAARLTDCVKNGPEDYTLTSEAENYPVNPSPWYAFKVSASKPHTINVTVDFIRAESRYLPKISTDGKSWKSIPHEVQDGKLMFSIDVDKHPITIAGQEIIDNTFYAHWLSELAITSGLEKSTLGRSTLNRPIFQLQTDHTSKNWLVIVGRMHPPEITGAMGLVAFVEELLFNKTIGVCFRKDFNVLIVPNLNPDGVEAGHWRHNSAGVDLNRDWNSLSQIETKIVHEKLLSIIDAGGNIAYAVDFHSTKKDVFYTMPADYGLKNPKLTENWLNLLDSETPGFTVLIEPNSNPKRGVFKQYMADEFGVHAVTYEVDDNADRQQIDFVAKKAAITLMKTLLDNNNAPPK